MGGLDLAMDALGFEPVVQVENAEYPRSILDLRWPDVLKVGDIRTFDAQGYGLGHLESVDMVIGGPPCQPVSHAGLRRGDDDERWLWGEALRVVGEAMPRIVFFENPMGIRTLGLDGILHRLDALGYGGAWEVVAAADVGAPHLRKRIFIMGVHGRRGWEGPTRPPGNRKVLWPSPNASGERPNEGNVQLLRQRVLAGDMTAAEASGMLNGKDVFSAQGKVPALIPTPSTADGTGGPGTSPRRAGGLNLRTWASQNPDADLPWIDDEGVPDINDPRWPGYTGNGDLATDDVLVAPPNAKDVTPERLWLTPSANEDAAGTINGNMQQMLTHQAKVSDPEGTAAGGQLSPDWTEHYLMGWPLHWTDINVPNEGLGGTVDWSQPEPSIPRVARGIANRSKRLTAIGNGVVPQQAEFAFRRLRERIGW